MGTDPATSEARTDYGDPTRSFTIPVEGETTEVTLIRGVGTDDETWSARAFAVEMVAAAAADVPRSERPGTVRVPEPGDFADADWTAGGGGDVVSVARDVDDSRPVVQGLDAVTPGDDPPIDCALATREDGDAYAFVPHALIHDVYADVAGVDDLDGAAFDRGIETIRGSVAPDADVPVTPGSVAAGIDRAAVEMFDEWNGTVTAERVAESAETKRAESTGRGR